jgi:hypothetical protein
LPDAELRDRFLARARAEGINFSATAVGPERVDSARVRWGFNWRPTLVIAASAVFAIFGTSLVRRYQLVPRPGLPSGQGIALIEENESLTAQLSALRGNIERDASDLDMLKHEELISEESLRQLQKRLDGSQEQAGQLMAQLQVLEGKHKDLASENQQKDAIIADLSVKNDKLHRDNADNLSSLVILESQIRDLTESLQQQSAAVERERQLMTVSKDVRPGPTLRPLRCIDGLDVLAVARYFSSTMIARALPLTSSSVCTRSRALNLVRPKETSLTTLSPFGFVDFNVPSSI